MTTDVQDARPDQVAELVEALMHGLEIALRSGCTLPVTVTVRGSNNAHKRYRVTETGEHVTLDSTVGADGIRPPFDVTYCGENDRLVSSRLSYEEAAPAN
jgi:hypothetical protein